MDIHLDTLDRHLVTVSNKLSRMEAMQLLIDKTLIAGKTSSELAAELAGKF